MAVTGNGIWSFHGVSNVLLIILTEAVYVRGYAFVICVAKHGLHRICSQGERQIRRSKFNSVCSGYIWKTCLRNLPSDILGQTTWESEGQGEAKLSQLVRQGRGRGGIDFKRKSIVPGHHFLCDQLWSLTSFLVALFSLRQDLYGSAGGALFEGSHFYHKASRCCGLWSRLLLHRGYVTVTLYTIQVSCLIFGSGLFSSVN